MRGQNGSVVVSWFHLEVPRSHSRMWVQAPSDAHLNELFFRRFGILYLWVLSSVRFVQSQIQLLVE